MTDKPTDEALENLFVEETGFATDDFPAAIFDFARAVLAKWGQPAQAADAEARRVDELTALRKQDTELIQQLVEALENSNATMWEEDDDPARPAHAAITAARARLKEIAP